MANLTRYKLKVRWHGDKDGFQAEGVVRESGEWVKFADIKELLQTSPSSAIVQCSAYAYGGLCKLFISRKCGSVPCQIALHQ